MVIFFIELEDKVLTQNIVFIVNRIKRWDFVLKINQMFN